MPGRSGPGRGRERSGCGCLAGTHTKGSRCRDATAATGAIDPSPPATPSTPAPRATKSSASSPRSSPGRTGTTSAPDRRAGPARSMCAAFPLPDRELTSRTARPAPVTQASCRRLPGRGRRPAGSSAKRAAAIENPNRIMATSNAPGRCASTCSTGATTAASTIRPATTRASPRRVTTCHPAITAAGSHHDAQHRPRVNAHRCALDHQRRHRGPQSHDGSRAVHTIRPGHARPHTQLSPALTPIAAEPFAGRHSCCVPKASRDDVVLRLT